MNLNKDLLSKISEKIDVIVWFENKTLSQAQHFIDLTDDDDDDSKNFVESMSSYSGRPGKKRKLK